MPTPQQASLTAFSARIASNSLTASDVALLTAALGNIVPAWGFGGSGAPPDLEGYGGQTDEPNAREWFATLYAIAEGFSGGGGPVVPASWLVPAWFINPVTGSDLNTGQDAAHPLKTYAQLVNLWGTVSPTLGQNTTITFQASQPDNTDPVVFRGTLTNGSSLIIQGTPTVVTGAVVLAGTVAKNRATGQLLTENLGATAAVGQMVRNTTAGKISLAFVYHNTAGTTFQVTQPLAPVALPFAGTRPPEVDTWANGDTVDLLALTNVHIVHISPTIADANATLSNGVVLYQLSLFIPAGDGVATPTGIGQAVSLWECTAAKILSGIVGQTVLALSQFVGNVLNLGGFVGTWSGGPRILYGGAYQGGAFSPDGNLIDIDGDFIFGATALVATRGATWGFVCVDNGNTITIIGDVNLASFLLASQALWGLGSLNIASGSHLEYPTGAGAAVANLLLTGGMQIDGSSNAHSVISGSPDVFNGGISITAAHLDAAAGAAGFGSNAFVPGGGSISNAT